MSRVLIALPSVLSPFVLRAFGFPPLVVLAVGALVVFLVLTVAVPIYLHEARRQWRRLFRDED